MGSTGSVVKQDSTSGSFKEYSIEAAIEKLKYIVLISIQLKELINTLAKTKFDLLRHLSVLRFLQKIQETPRYRVSSSKDVTEAIFGGGESRERSIRNWSDEYVRTRQMMVLRQGKHQKTPSLIDDADIRFSLFFHLRNVTPETIESESLAAWIFENFYLHPELTLDSPVNIHPNTARN